MVKPTTSPITKPPSRARVSAIIRRYVCKPDVTPNWRADIPAFYELWHQYPSLSFWEHHELDFPLNSMLWFKTEQGVATLKSDWVTFHWEPPTPDRAQDVVAAASVDDVPAPIYHSPVARRPSTLASFLTVPVSSPSRVDHRI